MSRWEGELNAGGGPESTDGCVSMKELSTVLGGEVVYEGNKDFIGDVIFDQKSVELPQDRRNMARGEGPGNGPVAAYGWTCQGDQ